MFGLKNERYIAAPQRASERNEISEKRAWSKQKLWIPPVEGKVVTTNTRVYNIEGTRHLNIYMGQLEVEDCREVCSSTQTGTGRYQQPFHQIGIFLQNGY